VIKFPRKLSNLAKAAFGTMQALKGFFSRLGKASEIRIQRVLEQLNILKRRQGDSPSRAVIDDLIKIKEEADEFYAIKNFVENMPPGLSPPQYFDLILDVLRKLNRAEEAMDDNGLYTFKYIAKTEGKYYDVFPVIMLTNKSGLYFRGFNFHWERAPEYVESVYRTYLYGSVQSRFYRIYPHELEYFLQIPTFMPIFIPKT
jgi:hypothetical protein